MLALIWGWPSFSCLGLPPTTAAQRPVSPVDRTSPTSPRLARPALHAPPDDPSLHRQPWASQVLGPLPKGQILLTREGGHSRVAEGAAGAPGREWRSPNPGAPRASWMTSPPPPRAPSRPHVPADRQEGSQWRRRGTFHVGVSDGKWPALNAGWGLLA